MGRVVLCCTAHTALGDRVGLRLAAGMKAGSVAVICCNPREMRRPQGGPQLFCPAGQSAAAKAC